MNNATLYQFRIKGHLDDSLAEWFEGLTITHLADGDSLLTGSIQDQAALHKGQRGKVTKVDDNYADIEIADGVKVKAVKSTITDVILPPGSAPAND